MDASALQAQATLGDGLPWVNMTLDYSDRICSLIPEDLLDWRSPDPSGRFSFSLAEIAMHIADARRMFVGQLGGGADQSKYWAADEEGDEATNSGWNFKPYGSKQAILDSLKESRELLAEYTAWPMSRVLETTEGTRKSFDNFITQMQEQGKEEEIAKARLRGPASVMRVLMAVACHEAGHRGSLQTLLRQHGVNTGSE
jgi:uncharacterized damage-inducible protein DinB